nr:hypothetical protein BN444_01315 [Xanthomonas translucens pv. translucens DSM 18974]
METPAFRRAFSFAAGWRELPASLTGIRVDARSRGRFGGLQSGLNSLPHSAMPFVGMTQAFCGRDFSPDA